MSDGIFFSKQKRLIPLPIITVTWEIEPLGEEIIERLTAAINVGELHHHNTLRSDGMKCCFKTL